MWDFIKRLFSKQQEVLTLINEAADLLPLREELWGQGQAIQSIKPQIEKAMSDNKITKVERANIVGRFSDLADALVLSATEVWEVAEAFRAVIGDEVVVAPSV